MRIYMCRWVSARMASGSTGCAGLSGDSAKKCVNKDKER